MRSRDIVRKAWQITQVHLKKLIWYGIIPSFFTVIVSSVYLAYQYNAFKTSPFFSDSSEHDVIGTARTVWGVISSHPNTFIVLLVIGILCLIGYTILPPIFRGTMINAVMKIKKYEPIEGSVEVGVRHFFPMFEFALLVGSFGITTLFTEGSFILRWWGENVFFVALPILLFIAMVGLIINFLFTYAEYFIIFEDKKLIRSLMESTILVISNLRKTFLMFILVLLISARVIINVLLILLIPMLVVVLSSYFASVFWGTVSLIIIGVFGLAVVMVSSYLLGLFHVFTTAVWVITFSVLTDKVTHTIHEPDKKTEIAKPSPNTPESLPEIVPSDNPKLF
jgi:hypothetical protein